MKISTKLLGVVFLILSMGCGDKFSDDDFLFNPPEQYSVYIETGWQNFRAGNYSEAIDAFQNASERDATQPEVYLGLGWSYARNRELSNAESNLQKALSFAFFDSLNQEKITAEASAGIGLVKLAEGNYKECTEFMALVLSLDDNFSFSQDPTVNITRLKLAKAKSHYYLNEIESCFLLLQDLGVSIAGAKDTVVVGNLSNEDFFNGEMLVSVPAELRLISGTTVEANGVSYQILRTYEGTHQLLVSGNPVGDTGHTVVVNCFFTMDYSDFLNKLLSTVTSYQYN